MKPWLVCFVAFGATTSAAVAEPVFLADADMDAVTAGGVSDLIPAIPLHLWDEIDAEAGSQVFHDWGGDLVQNLEFLGEALAAEANESTFILSGGTITRTKVVENGTVNWTFVATETVGDGTVNRGFVITETIENDTVKRMVQQLDAQYSPIGADGLVIKASGAAFSPALVSGGTMWGQLSVFQLPPGGPK